MMAMFLKLTVTYIDESGDVVKGKGDCEWFNMDQIATFNSNNWGGSALHPEFDDKESPWLVDESPEELMEMMAVKEPPWHAYAVNNILRALGRLDKGPSGETGPT